MRLLTAASDRVLSLFSRKVRAEAGCTVIRHYCWCTATCVNECVWEYENCRTKRICVS